METVTLDGEKVQFKKGAMRRQMQLKADERLSRAKLERIAKTEAGKSFKMFGRNYIATPLLKRRARFGLVLMDRHS